MNPFSGSSTTLCENLVACGAAGPLNDDIAMDGPRLSIVKLTAMQRQFSPALLTSSRIAVMMRQNVMLPVLRCLL